MRKFNSLVRQRFELIFWATSIILLFFMNTDAPAQTLCVFTLLDLGNCPGCGLAHAIHYAMHGKFSLSYSEHILGIPAVLIILNRIKQLSFTPQPKTTV